MRPAILSRRLIGGDREAAIDSVAASEVPSRSRVAPGTVSSLLALASKMSMAQFAPLAVSLYVAGLVAAQGGLQFSAYSLVNSLNVTVFIAVSSFLQGLYYVGGRAIGRNELVEYRTAIKAGAAIALVTALLASVLSALAGPILATFGVDARVLGQAGMIGMAAVIGILPAQLLVVYRVHAALNGQAGLVTLISVLGAVGSAAAATLVIGRAGDPDQAVLWVVVSVALVNWVMLAVAAVSLACLRSLRFPRVESGDAGTSFRRMLVIVWNIGWPIGAVVFLDSLASFISTLLTARYWLAAVPAHSVVWLWIVMSLVVPLGVAQATTQRVAVTHAQGDLHSRNAIVIAALVLAALYGVLGAAALTAFPLAFGGLLAPASDETAPLLRQLMPLGGIVLALQAVIIVAAATLRGIGLTRAPLFQAFIGYCVVATGAQFLLAIVLGIGPAGIWWGLIIGFGVTAIAVLWRCVREFRIGKEPDPVTGGDAGISLPSN